LKDSEGNTPLHVAILNQHSEIIEILLKQTNIDLKIKNNAGQTPFATALMRKNNNATCLILKRDPSAAEQVNRFQLITYIFLNLLTLNF
jgi:ankyrin repeat protein